MLAAAAFVTRSALSGIQPVDEQERAVATPQLDLELRRLSILALGRKLDLDFAAVLDEVMLRLDSNGWGHVAEFGDTSP